MDVFIEFPNGECIVLETFSCLNIYDEDLLKEEIMKKLKEMKYNISIYKLTGSDFNFKLTEDIVSEWRERIRGYEEMDSRDLFDIAIKQGKMEIVVALAFGAPRDPECYKGRFYPLNRAVETENFNMVEYLVKVGFQINISDDCWSPLLWATHKSNVQITKFLLETGASQRSDKNGMTPLIKSVLRGNVDILESLIEHGATQTYDNDGWSAMKYAKSFKKADAIEVLGNNGFTT